VELVYPYWGFLNMAPEESRKLNIGDRVYWQDDAMDQGEIVGRDWSGVQIKWNGCRMTYYHHNDIERVRLMPKVV
jgi:hypothetical protein